MLCRHAEVRATFDAKCLVYIVDIVVRRKWCFSIRMDDANYYKFRRALLTDMVAHPPLSIFMVCPCFPEKVARHVAAMERVLEKDQIRVRFANGHYVDISTTRMGEVGELSEYDHANLLMVYDLPPR